MPEGLRQEVLQEDQRLRQVSLSTLIKKPLKVNTVITVIVSKPGSSSAVKILKIRARKSPAAHLAVPARRRSKPTAC